MWILTIIVKRVNACRGPCEDYPKRVTPECRTPPVATTPPTLSGPHCEPALAVDSLAVVVPIICTSCKSRAPYRPSLGRGHVTQRKAMESGGAFYFKNTTMLSTAAMLFNDSRAVHVTRVSGTAGYRWKLVVLYMLPRCWWRRGRLAIPKRIALLFCKSNEPAEMLNCNRRAHAHVKLEMCKSRQIIQGSSPKNNTEAHSDLVSLH